MKKSKLFFYSPFVIYFIHILKVLPENINDVKQLLYFEVV